MLPFGLPSTILSLSLADTRAHTFLFLSSSRLFTTLFYNKHVSLSFLNSLHSLFRTIGLCEMTLKGGTSQACAACKFHRRKCIRDCPLAPYFPPDQPKMFQNAHRLFGVSNILKILNQLDPTQKFDAMQSIIFQSNLRDKFPVLGCVGYIRQLYCQILQAEQELHAVHTQLALYRQQQQQQNDISSMPNDTTSELQALALFHPEAPQPYNAVASLPIASHLCNNVDYNSGYIDSQDNNVVNSFWVQHPYSNNSTKNLMGMQSQMVESQAVSIHQEASQDYDEMHPFFDTVDDRQSSIDSKEAYELSLESSLKDTTQSIEHVAENELKNAAAFFSLTSVN